MYRHTQIGWTIICILGIIFLFTASNIFKGDAVAFAGAILLLAIVMFAKLTITLDDTHIRLVFGLIGFPRRTFRLADIESCYTDKNLMYAISLGIHYGLRGSLYNVSGPWVVVLVMKNGRKVNIGTDEPEKLKQAIAEKLANFKGVLR